jgi:hypothetical protein
VQSCLCVLGALLIAACSVEDEYGLAPAPSVGTGGSAGSSVTMGGRGGEAPPADAAPDEQPPLISDPADAAALDAAVPDATVISAPPDGPPPLSLAVNAVSPWRGGADAAYSIIHDSVCDLAGEGAFTHADPALTTRGLHAGFAAIVGQCQPRDLQRLRTLTDHGHEVLSQSWSHKCLGSPAECGPLARGAPPDLMMELDRSTRQLETTTGQSSLFFVFPFDACGAPALARLKQLGYLGARCGPRGISDAQIADPFATRFDGWGPTYSVYVNTGPCRGLRPFDNTPPETVPPACRSYVLSHYLDEAIQQGGWGVRAFTSFSDDQGAFQPVTPADYNAHLDDVVARAAAGRLWVAGPATVVKYRQASKRCPLPSVTGGSTLHFEAPSEECRSVGSTLTYVISTTDMSDPAGLTITQGPVTTPLRHLGPGRFLADADPTKGDAAVR